MKLKLEEYTHAHTHYEAGPARLIAEVFSEKVNILGLENKSKLKYGISPIAFFS